MEVLFGFVAEAIIAVVVNHASERPVFGKLKEALQGGSIVDKALANALTAAYGQFASKYPDLANSLLDEHYLKQERVIAELSKCLLPTESPDIAVLDQAFRAQFFQQQPAGKYSEPLRYFVEKLETAIMAQPELRPFVDSRALQSILQVLRSVSDTMQPKPLDYQKFISELVRHFTILGNLTVVEDREAYAVAYRETAVAIEFFVVVTADASLNTDTVTKLADNYFEVVCNYVKGVTLKRALTPNAVLLFLFTEDSPADLIQFITSQTRISHHPLHPGVVVCWAADLMRRKVYSHNNPVSWLPPVVILPQFAFPTLKDLSRFIAEYRD
jgi:hypothetical protein